MAVSKSLQQGQIAVSCQLCEKDPTEAKIQWKCLDCDLLLCAVCRDKRHTKFKKAIHHTIVDITESTFCGTASWRIDFSDTSCDLHPKNECCALCSTCKKMVCIKCITKNHSGHDLIDEEEYNNKRHDLKERQRKIEEHILEIELNQDKINKVKDEENQKFQRGVGEILKQRNRFKELSEQLLDKLEEKHQTVTVAVDAGNRTLENKKEEFNKKVMDSKELLDCQDLIQFYEDVDNMSASLTFTNTPLTLNYKPLPFFCPGRIDVNSVGVLTDENATDKKSLKTQLSVIKQYKSELAYIHYITSCSDGTLWIGDNRSEKLQHVTLKEDGIQISSTFDTRIFGMAVLPSDDLLLSVGESVLKKVNGQTGAIEDSIYSVAPLKSIIVHITSNNSLMISGLSHGKVFPVSGRRVVVVMDLTGNHIVEYEVDTNYKRLFHYPERICTTTSGNIFVVDITQENGKGRVVVLNSEGHVVNVYNGHLDVNTNEKPFKPGEITITSKIEIFVTDCWNNTIHILNNEGELISFLNTKDIGIQYPFSIISTDNQQLYIGCISCKATADNGKLYTVKYSS